MPVGHSIFQSERRLRMFDQLWGTLGLLVPVFLLLAMMFGAGFVIGRVTKKEE
jgi:uncharacterized membrane protein YGL010W